MLTVSLLYDNEKGESQFMGTLFSFFLEFWFNFINVLEELFIFSSISLSLCFFFFYFFYVTFSYRTGHISSVPLIRSYVVSTHSSSRRVVHNGQTADSGHAVDIELTLRNLYFILGHVLFLYSIDILTVGKNCTQEKADSSRAALKSQPLMALNKIRCTVHHYPHCAVL